MYYILLALTQPCCGADIMKKVTSLSNNRVVIGPGTLYALLSKFLALGMILLTGSEGRRKTYLLTDKGWKMLYTEYERIHTLSEDGRPIMEGILYGQKEDD